MSSVTPEFTYRSVMVLMMQRAVDIPSERSETTTNQRFEELFLEAEST